MEEIKKKFPLTIFEIVLLIIVIPILFYYSEKLLWTLGETGDTQKLNWFITCIGYLLEKPWNPWGPLLILGFNCLWIIAMKLLRFKILRIKIYLTLLLFTISAAILTMWFLGNLFRGWIPS
jgi:hypothetical protein